MARLRPIGVIKGYGETGSAGRSDIFTCVPLANRLQYRGVTVSPLEPEPPAIPFTLTGSVGSGGVNATADVRTVQTLLVLAHRTVGVPSFAPAVDGANGPNTVQAIQEFQKDHMQAAVVDGRVDVGGATLAALAVIGDRPVVTVLQPGDTTKLTPYTIALIANPALETGPGTGAFLPDPIQTDPTAFDRAAAYTYDVLFGRLVGQAERLLADAAIGLLVRVVKVWHAGLSPADTTALVTHFPPNLTEARRTKFAPFLANYGLTADVAYALTASATHERATAWFTTEDTTRGGVAFTVDGAARTHWHFCAIPGTVAQHVSSRSMTGLHEFGHAASSFTDGMVVDQYVDGGVGINNKKGRPIPTAFGTVDAATFRLGRSAGRAGLPGRVAVVPPGLDQPAVPSLMDNYWMAPSGVPEQCVFDTLTRAFFRARLLAKLSRP